MREAVIVAAKRTPIGKAYRGAFNNTNGTTLLAKSIEASVEQAGIDPGEIEDVAVGCAMQQGTTGMNVARNGALKAGIPYTAAATTIDRACSSGLMAAAWAANQIITGGAKVTIGAGVESISLVQTPKMNIATGLSAVGSIVNLKNYIIAMASGRYIGMADPDVAPTIMTVQDVLVLNFDDELGLQEVAKIQKEYTKVYAYPPHRYVAGLRLSKMIAGAGFFDYSFTKSNIESGEQVLVYNSMNSKLPHIGIVNIEKGADVTPKKLEFSQLQEYSIGEGEEKLDEMDDEEVVQANEENTSLRISNAGVTKANEGKVLVYYIEKDRKQTKGTLKMWFESLD